MLERPVHRHIVQQITVSSSNKLLNDAAVITFVFRTVIELVHSCPQTVDLLASAVNAAGFTRSITRKYDSISEREIKIQAPSSPICQLWILLGRMLLQRWRNKPFLISQIVHHVISSVLLGAIFYGIGNNAAFFLPNFKLALSVGVFYVYTYVMVPVLNCKQPK